MYRRCVCQRRAAPNWPLLGAALLGAALLGLELLHPRVASAEPGLPSAQVVSPARVKVRVLGGRLAGLGASLAESLSRLGLSVELSRPESMGLAELGESDVRASVWVEAGASGATLLVLAGGSGEVLAKQQLAAAPDNLLEEQLTLLIRAALETQLGGAREAPGGATESAGAPEASVLPRGSDAPLPPVAAERPVSPGFAPAPRPGPWLDLEPVDADAKLRARGWVLDLSSELAAHWLSPELGAVPSVGASIGLEQRDYVFAPGVELGLSRATAQVTDELVTLQATWWQARGLARWSFVEGDRVAITGSLGAALYWSSVEVRDLAPGLVVSADEARADLVFHTGLAVRVWLARNVSAKLFAVLQVDPRVGGYGVARGGDAVAVLRDGELRPGLGLALVGDLYGSRAP